MPNTKTSFFAFIFCSFFLSAQSSTDSVPEQEKKQSFIVKIFSTYTQNLDYLKITTLMAVESTFIPLPSEIVVPPAAYQACNPENTKLHVTDSEWLNMAFVVFFATLGAVCGALINYTLAFFLGRPFIYWFAETKVGKFCLLSTKKVQNAENYFVKNGAISTFMGRLLPGIRHLISIPAGLAKMKLGSFILYTFIGAGIWNIVLALLGYFAHGQQEFIDRYSHIIAYGILGFVVVVGGVLLYKAFRKK